MFIRSFVLALPLFAAVSALPSPAPAADAGQCNTGPIQCCKSVQSSNSQAVTSLTGLLGIVVDGVAGLVGLNCSPITVVGAGGTNCNAQPVCCNNNQFNGLIAIGCTPININL